MTLLLEKYYYDRIEEKSASSSQYSSITVKYNSASVFYRSYSLLKYKHRKPKEKLIKLGSGISSTIGDGMDKTDMDASSSAAASSEQSLPLMPYWNYHIN